MTVSIYNRKEWVLGTCTECGKENYVEPHGLTATCRRCGRWSEHESIPESARRGLDRLIVDIPALRKLVPLRKIAK